MTGFFKVNLQLEEISSVPSAVSGAIILYADSASHRLYARNASGAYILGSMDNPMTNAGDLIVGGASGVPTRMGVGTANQALTVNSDATGIAYSDGSAIPAVAQNTSDISDLQTSKQDVLTAGTGIDITNDTISATLATTDSAGIVQPDGTTITIADGVISGVPGFENPMTTAGDIIVGGVSGTATRMGIGASNYVLGVNSAGTALEYSDGSDIPAVAGKQDALTAGTGIDITSDTISATIATSSDFGIIKPDNVTVTVTDGVLTSLSSGGMTNPMTTAGDIIVGGASGAPTRLGLGTANQALTVNSAGTGVEYSDGSAIPAVAQNTSDIANLAYQIDAPDTFYLTSTETSTGSGVYVLTTTTPTAVSGTTLSATVGSSYAKIFEFSYTFPASGKINTTNGFAPDLTFSGLDTTKVYSVRFVVKHVAQDSTETQVAVGTVAFTPSSTTYTCHDDISNVLTDRLSFSAGDKLVFEVYGRVVTAPTTFASESLPDSATTQLNGVCYGAGKFVAVGNGGKIYTSPDGVTWTERNSDVSGNLLFVYYGNGKFVACDYYNRYFITSSDGETWSKTYYSSIQTSYAQYCGAYGAGKYVVCGSTYAYYSTDATTWSRASKNYETRSLCYVDSIGFVGIGTYGDLAKSSDGISWTISINQAGGTNKYGICYGNGKFVTVGVYGGIYTSTDATTWTSQTSGVSVTLNSVCFADGVFVAVGDSGTIITSSDGVTWTAQTSGVSTTLTGVANDDSGNHSIVGYSGTVLLGTPASVTGVSCDLDVEDPTALACLHEDITPYILAENVHTTISNITQSQQAYNESVATSLAGKQNTLSVGTGISISGSNVISATTANSGTLGIVRPDNSTITINNGVLSCSPQTVVTFRYWN